MERPIPSDGEVLVRVKAASVNRADLDGLKPKPSFVRLFMGLRAPKSHEMGIDVAGVVDAVGDGVTRFKPGDEVMTDMFAAGKFGAFAEYVCAREKAFEPIPPGMSFEEAATLPHSAVLALQGLRMRDGRTVRPGDEVLIDGASGNVGPFAVQIAKSMGAEVTGIASGDKLDFVRSLGADHVIDYETGRLHASRQSATTGSWRSTRTTRSSVSGEPSSRTASTPRWAARPAASWRRSSPAWSSRASAASGPAWCCGGSRCIGPTSTTLKELIAAGKVKPVIDRRYPLDQVVDALRWVEDGHASGKVVITVDDT